MGALAAPAVEPTSLQTERRSFIAKHSRTVLAASGFVMLAFIVVRMAGNLLTFTSSSTIRPFDWLPRLRGTRRCHWGGCWPLVVLLPYSSHSTSPN
jgi:hypothetical protein